MKYRKGYKYQLAEDVVFQTEVVPEKRVETQFIKLEPSGLLVVKSGYAWDGPSGPTLDWPKKHTMRGPCAHDALYQLMRQGLIPGYWRDAADETMYNYLIIDKMWKWRAKLWRREVRKFAGFAADPANRKKVYEI